MASASRSVSRALLWKAFWLAVLVGLLGGLIGLGGAEFRLPVLVALLGYTLKSAVPVNLAVSFATLLAALPARARSVPLDGVVVHLPEIAAMIAGGMTAAFYGADLLASMSTQRLSKIVLWLLIALGVVMIGDAFLQEGHHLVDEPPVVRFCVGVFLGVGIGLVSSLLGVAGGELIIPSFVLVFAAGIKLAGTMSIFVSLPTILVGLVRHLRSGALNEGAHWRTILVMAPGSIIGAVLGGLLVGMVPAQVLKVGLGLILIWSAFRVFAHTTTTPKT